MSAAEVDALLERLVAQFESPYDFLRELVQNAMDAGSDRVEVTLETHPLDGSSDEVIFELTIIDTGAGMDEAIIDQELTRLFSSGKSGDRTMAGGFGIGFVSVFAWEPEAVLLHTGRAGESWELVFHGDRSFEKVAVEDPIEGTTISLFRRGRASEREPIAEAIRDSLWRWCRFCPIELSFEDLGGDEPAELIQDSPEPTELGLGAGLTRAEVRGESTLRVSFAVPPNAVFLRRGLILAEGGPKQLLAKVADALGTSAEHLQIWADSPLLRTSLARDTVLHDEGRDAVEGRLLALLAQLREDLLARLEQLAATGDGELDEADAADNPVVDPRWTHERHAIYGALHAHLELEYAHLERKVGSRAILRDVAHARAVGLAVAVRTMGGRPLLVVAPAALRTGGVGEAETPIAAGLARLVRDLRPTSFPVLAGDLRDDRSWLTALTALTGTELLPVERAIARVVPRKGEATGLCGVVESLLRGLGFEQSVVRVGEFVDLLGRPEHSPVFGPEVFGAAAPLAFHGGRTIPALSLARRTVWLNVHNSLVEAAIDRFTERPLVAGLALTCGLLGHLDHAPEVSDVAKLAEQLERDSQGARK